SIPSSRLRRSPPGGRISVSPVSGGFTGFPGRTPERPDKYSPIPPSPGSGFFFVCSSFFQRLPPSPLRIENPCWRVGLVSTDPLLTRRARLSGEPLPLQTAEFGFVDALKLYFVAGSQREVAVRHVDQLERRAADQVPATRSCLRVDAGLPSRQAHTAC